MVFVACEKSSTLEDLLQEKRPLALAQRRERGEKHPLTQPRQVYRLLVETALALLVTTNLEVLAALDGLGMHTALQTLHCRRRTIFLVVFAFLWKTGLV